MNILVINAGSSSLKYQFIKIEEEKVLAKGLCERIGIEGSKLTLKVPGKDDYVVEKHMDDHSVAISMVIDALTDKDHGVISDMKEIDAVGHRVVHGGEIFACSVVIDEKVKEALEVCSELAPLHNPANIIGIEACEKAMPGVPQVGVFDTAFHQSMPKKAYMYALPYELYTKHKIRRYGFHGTSHRFVSERAAEMLGKPIEELKIITCHLGNGSSIAAVDCGKSVDTSMGFTPLAGVEMGTRCGDVDPSAVLYIMEKENLTPGQMSDLLNKKSGFLGVTEGYSSDSRDLESAIGEGPDGEHYAQARLAMDILVQQIKKIIGSYAAEMNGVDAIVFTAGIGENNVALRKSVLSDMEFLGITVDDEANKKAFRQGNIIKISGEDSKVLAYVIPTNEEIVIARDTRDIAAAL